MLQGFNWASSENKGWYNSLKNNIPDLANVGITRVWLPPPSHSAADQGTLLYFHINIYIYTLFTNSHILDFSVNFLIPKFQVTYLEGYTISTHQNTEHKKN